MAMMASLLRPAPLLLIAALLRVALLVYGTYQDAHSAIKYTDIDYLVFTDASRYVWHAQSPYARDTYRYTPLLAWLLLPTVSFFAFGKVIFALADLLAGWLILRILRRRGIPPEQAGAFAALWLWNPMVATISTRGSAEGLLGVLATALVWAAEGHRVNLAAVLLGLGVHFKIYPCIWAPAIAWWMDDDRPRRKQASRFLSRDRIQLAAVSLATFTGLNVLMYAVYVLPLFFIYSSYHNYSNRLPQLRPPVPRAHLFPPPHSHRPPAQLLALQRPAVPRVLAARHPPARRVARLPPAAVALVRPHPAGPGQEGPGDEHDGADVCLCHLQQGVHLAGKPFPAH